MRKIKNIIIMKIIYYFTINYFCKNNNYILYLFQNLKITYPI